MELNPEVERSKFVRSHFENHRVGGDQICCLLESFQRGAERLQIVGEADVPGGIGGAIGLAEEELVFGWRGVF